MQPKPKGPFKCLRESSLLHWGTPAVWRVVCPPPPVSGLAQGGASATQLILAGDCLLTAPPPEEKIAVRSLEKTSASHDRNSNWRRI